MFILDLTASMDIWLNEIKINIKNIIEEITLNNPGSNIRLSFIGYRDFYTKEEKREYFIKEFTDKINEVKDYISTLDCLGGGDLPEDLIGAMKLALNMKWESKAKYALLICDAPCHGRKYHNLIYDKFEDGDPEGTSLEYLIEQFKLKEINLYCLEIGKYNEKMFDIMKKVYNDDNKFHVEKLSNYTQLSFFVAFSASVVLNNEKYRNNSFQNIIETYRKDDIGNIMKKYIKNNDIMMNINNIEKDLIEKFENLELEQEDKKLLDFVNRMNELNLDNKKNDNNTIESNIININNNED